jgi:hypothetical protein
MIRNATSSWGRIAAVLLLAATAQAEILYDNGEPDNLTGHEMSRWIEAEDFSLVSTSAMTQIAFWASALNDTSYQHSILWRIYEDNLGIPGQVIAGGEVVPTETLRGAGAVGTSSRYDFGLDTPVVLNAGIYWLGLHNGPLTNTVFKGFYWESSSPTNISAAGRADAFPFDDGIWQSTNRQHAFQISTPEPATIGTAIAGLCLVLLRLRIRV